LTSRTAVPSPAAAAGSKATLEHQDTKGGAMADTKTGKKGKGKKKGK